MKGRWLSCFPVVAGVVVAVAAPEMTNLGSVTTTRNPVPKATTEAGELAEAVRVILRIGEAEN